MNVYTLYFFSFFIWHNQVAPEFPGNLPAGSVAVCTSAPSSGHTPDTLLKLHHQRRKQIKCWFHLGHVQGHDTGPWTQMVRRTVIKYKSWTEAWTNVKKPSMSILIISHQHRLQNTRYTEPNYKTWRMILTMGIISPTAHVINVDIHWRTVEQKCKRVWRPYISIIYFKSRILQ